MGLPLSRGVACYRELRRILLLGTSVNKLENGTLLRMCPTTLACSAR